MYNKTRHFMTKTTKSTTEATFKLSKESNNIFWQYIGLVKHITIFFDAYSLFHITQLY